MSTLPQMRSSSSTDDGEATSLSPIQKIENVLFSLFMEVRIQTYRELSILFIISSLYETNLRLNYSSTGTHRLVPFSSYFTWSWMVRLPSFNSFHYIFAPSSITLHHHPLHAIATVAIQMLRFPINPYPSMPWSDQVLGRSLFTVLQPLWFLATPQPSPSGIVVNASEIYIISIIWISFFVGLFFFSMYIYSRVSVH